MGNYKGFPVVVGTIGLATLIWWVWYSQYRFHPIIIDKDSELVYSNMIAEDQESQSVHLHGALIDRIAQQLMSPPAVSGYYQCPLDTWKYIQSPSLKRRIYVWGDRLVFQDATGYREWVMPGIETELEALRLSAK